MKALSLAVAVLVIALFVSGPARADYSIIRWMSGDCTIWDDVGLFARPSGSGWAPVVVGIPTYDAAKSVLEDMYRRGLCR